MRLLRLSAILLFFQLIPGGSVSCAHEQPAGDVPLYEELLFAQMRQDKPKPKYEFPFDNLLIDDEIPVNRRGKPVELKRPKASQWEEFKSGCDSQSVGKASRGKLAGGRLLEETGRGYRRKNDKAPYGTDEAVAVVLWAASRMADMYPGTVPLIVGDLSAEKGGRLRPHSSHQSGRDVDLGYYFAGNEAMDRFADATGENLDAEKTWTLIDLLLSTHRVEYIFIDRSLHETLYKEAVRRGWGEDELEQIFEAPVGESVRSGVIRHQKGHRHHLHVRFACDESDKECK